MAVLGLPRGSCPGFGRGLVEAIGAAIVISPVGFIVGLTVGMAGPAGFLGASTYSDYTQITALATHIEIPIGWEM